MSVEQAELLLVRHESSLEVPMAVAGGSGRAGGRGISELIVGKSAGHKPAGMLDAQAASVRTASVHVKTLTVDRKQVTLAMFRQLPMKDLVDPDTCTLRGVPWGWVNYHHDCASLSGEGGHLHVVWTTGGLLHQGIATEEPPVQVVAQLRRAARKRLAARLAVRMLEGLEPIASDGYNGPA